MKEYICSFMVFYDLPKLGSFYTEAIPVYINGKRWVYPNGILAPLIRYLGSDRKELWPEDWLHAEYKIEPLYDIPEGMLFFASRILLPIKEPIAKCGSVYFYGFPSEESVHLLFEPLGLSHLKLPMQSPCQD